MAKRGEVFFQCLIDDPLQLGGATSGFQAHGVIGGLRSRIALRRRRRDDHRETAESPVAIRTDRSEGEEIVSDRGFPSACRATCRRTVRATTLGL